MAAFLVCSVAWATAQSAPHVLPAGTAVVFVSEGHFDARAKPGASIRAHLKDDLVLDGSVIAPAGTHARLALVAIAKDGKQTIALHDFTTRYGLLPVRASAPVYTALDGGDAIAAVTAARVEHLGDRYAIVVPFPFALASDAPASVYTSTPARTAPPIYRAPPRSSPSPAPAPTPSPETTKIPE